MKEFLLKHKRRLLGSVAVLLVGAVSFVGYYSFTSNKQIAGNEPQNIGVAFPDSRWYFVDIFQGFQTKKDPTKINSGANANGQNTIINDGDRISSRDWGYEILGTVTTTEDPITALHTFRKRDGTNLLMRSRGAYLEYFEETGDNWETLISTATYGAAYGFADFNINTDLRSFVYF